VSDPRRPGRPRSSEADAAILRTTLELLVDEGLQGVAVERVAARAGVAKTTVYRRFASRQELAVAALGTLLPRGAGEIDTGSARGDYLELARRRLAMAPSSKWNLLMPRLVVESASDPELYALVRRILVDPTRALLAAIVRRGLESGELPNTLDVDLGVDVLLGPLVYRILIDRGELDAIVPLPERLFDLIAGDRVGSRPARR